MQGNKPTIHVLYHETHNPNVFQQLLFGMEEEQVPYSCNTGDLDSSAELSYQAAQQSVLGVGLGISAQGNISLHYQKLPKDEPIFTIHMREENKLRPLGSNAARLVKGMPFKDLEVPYEKVEAASSPKDSSSEESIDLEELRIQIESLVKKVLTEMAESSGR